MTLDEMKLSVCEKLPKLIDLSCTSQPCWYENAHGINWSGRPVRWPTEGLQVCHEAEKLLTVAERMCYGESMWQLCTGELLDYSGCYYEGEAPSIDYKELYPIINATYEQRLKALCRVWFPERFI